MNAQTVTPSSAQEINRLHDEAKRHIAASRQELHQGLSAAWRAGQLLIAEKALIMHRQGSGGWLLWLEANFSGSVRTAQRYMRLAELVEDSEFLCGLSLRQAYARLGIATEPKGQGKRLRHKLPVYLLHANRLMRSLRRRPGQTEEESTDSFRRDLRGLYEKLRALFDAEQVRR